MEEPQSTATAIASDIRWVAAVCDTCETVTVGRADPTFLAWFPCKTYDEPGEFRGATTLVRSERFRCPVPGCEGTAWVR